MPAPNRLSSVVPAALLAFAVGACWSPGPATQPARLPTVTGLQARAETVATRPRWYIDQAPFSYTRRDAREGQSVALRPLPKGWVVAKGLTRVLACTEGKTEEPSCPASQNEPIQGPVACLGGDYWRAPFWQGQEGACWIRTGESPEKTGGILSPWFRPFGRYLHFLVHVNSTSPEGKRAFVDVVAEGRYEPLFVGRRPLHGSETARVTIDLGADANLGKGYAQTPVRIRLVDDDVRGNVAVKDIVVTDSDAFPVRPTPLWGFADLHAHLFSNVGFGGRLVHGRVHSSVGDTGELLGHAPSDPRAALPSCEAAHGSNGDKTLVLSSGWNHFHQGWPEFGGWPRFDVVLEQQAYVEWIRRAYEGGLRLVHVDVVNNAVLAPTMFAGGGNSLSDVWNIDHQIQAARAFAEQPDVRSWAEIATSAAEVRRIVGSGKLAMILGVEVDDFGDMTGRLRDLQSESQVRAILRKYVGDLWARGVRHVVPIHLLDNAFGGAAVYNALFDGSNKLHFGQHFGLRDGSPDGIFYRLDHEYEDEGMLVSMASLTRGTRVGRETSAEERRWLGHANAKGFTRAGRVLLEELMRKGIVIDVDHMSDLATEQTLCFAETHGYPVIASHTGFRELGFKGANTLREGRSTGTRHPAHFATERDRTSEQVERIRALGGMVGVGVGAGVRSAENDDRWLAGDRRFDACDGSTALFAKQYFYGLVATGGGGIALGTDINGFATLLNPRFGPLACLAADDRGLGGAERAEQAGAQRCPVRYLPSGAVRSPRRFEIVANDKRSGPAYAREKKLWLAVSLVENGMAGAAQSLREVDPIVRRYATGFWRARCSSARKCQSADCAGACLSEPADPDESAAFLGASDRPCPPGANACTDAKRVWRTWNEDEGCREYPPMKKSVMLDRPVVKALAEVDLNFDGLGHYGLLPDVLQDSIELAGEEDRVGSAVVRWSGLSVKELAPLFRGAEDYAAMWEAIEARAEALVSGDPAGLGPLDCRAPRGCACGMD